MLNFGGTPHTEYENADLSSPLNAEFDWNEIDESDSYDKKYDE
jgi:hypothetical protein